MTLKYIVKVILALVCHLHVHFSYLWPAFASRNLPAIAELLVFLVLLCSEYVLVQKFIKCGMVVSVIKLTASCGRPAVSGGRPAVSGGVQRCPAAFRPTVCTLPARQAWFYTGQQGSSAIS